jgi:gliding motility-associated-like protein
VTDILQSGYSYISSTSTNGNYDSSTALWTIGHLNIGISETLTVSTIVNALGNYSNTAIIDGIEVDGDIGNNTSTVLTYPTDFLIPDGFSPNGDGTNDLFVIRGIVNYPTNIFVIFNRWGNKVFEASPYLNNWDGHSMFGLRVGGDELPIGTYFYVLDLKDGSPVFKGTIYLNR